MNEIALFARAGERRSTVSMAQPTKIAVIDRHPLFQEALARVFRNAWPDVEVVALRNGEDLSVEHARFDVILADLDALGGPAALRQVVADDAGVPVILLSQRCCAQQVWSAIGDGARAYLPKTSPGEIIRDAVALVLAGSTCFPADVFPDAVRETPWFASVQMKSRRELDVLRRLDRGCSNKVIARELGVSIGLVKLHVQAILRATGARNRTEAISNARRMGMLPVD